MIIPALRQDADTIHTCYHCGEDCLTTVLEFESETFCCEGCKIVYELLSKQGMCTYYALNQAPGSNRRMEQRNDKFLFLDDEKIATRLIDFKGDVQTCVLFYLPQIHCSSCLWLLENLHKLHAGIESARVDFTRKEVRVLFHHQEVSLKEVADLLTDIGYEPYISLHNFHTRKPPQNRKQLLQLGVAAFCFSNIMLMSFPEYLGLDPEEAALGKAFRYLNLLLSLPVLIYSASGFYIAAWKGVRNKLLNIDAPIVLAILVTFGRSLYEVLSGTGGGYFDSMTGIVFFMLTGRWLQDITYRRLSFDRDYTAYFPVAVTKIIDDKEVPVALPDIKVNDTLLIHHGELIPTDGILTCGKAYIDYSFVTGESTPVTKETGSIVYAGGRQTASNIELLVTREIAQSYLTRLWNHRSGKDGAETKRKSFVDLISKYFTYIVLLIAASAALFWWIYDPGRIWNAVSAILIIACPCALLLCTTFTSGNMLRIFSRQGLYLRDAIAIENMGRTEWIIFDKTGTLTSSRNQTISYEGEILSDGDKSCIKALAAQSTHPLSKRIVTFLTARAPRFVQSFQETAGGGIAGEVGGVSIKLGSKVFVGGRQSIDPDKQVADAETVVYVVIDNVLKGCFRFHTSYRHEVPALLHKLKSRYNVAILSGDNDADKTYLQGLLTKETPILFFQKPEDKLLFVENLIAQGKNVMMIGDGLNDAGAMKAATTGIVVSEDTNQFTPASDGILDAASMGYLPDFITKAAKARAITIAAFIVSLVYNIVGLAFAVQGLLHPMVAAILMPSSSITILAITYGLTTLNGKLWR